MQLEKDEEFIHKLSKWKKMIKIEDIKSRFIL